MGKAALVMDAGADAAKIAEQLVQLFAKEDDPGSRVKLAGVEFHKYKLMDAVNDGATLQILYEGKTADAALYDKHGFETAFEDLFKAKPKPL